MLDVKCDGTSYRCQRCSGVVVIYVVVNLSWLYLVIVSESHVMWVGIQGIIFFMKTPWLQGHIETAHCSSWPVTITICSLLNAHTYYIIIGKRKIFDKINFNVPTVAYSHLWPCEQLGHIFSCDFRRLSLHFTVSYKLYTGKVDIVVKE